MKKLLLISFLLSGLALRAQLTVEQCHELARTNYPQIREYGLVEKSRDLNLSNAAKAWLPGVSVSVYGAGMTDLMDFPAAATAMLGDTKNWVAAGSVMVSQNIYDGGQTVARQGMARAEADVEKAGLDVTMYTINSRVDQLFFGILTLDEQIRQSHLLQEDLAIAMKQVRSMMQGGMANQSDIDAIEVERVKARQGEKSLETVRRTYVSMLSHYIGKPVSEPLAIPSAEFRPAASIRRPELNYFAARSQMLNYQKKMLDARLRPTVGAFALGAYHTDMLSSMKNALGVVGLRLSWNISPLYSRKNDLRRLETQREQIESERNTFLFNNRLENDNACGAIDNLKEQIALDEQIISLRDNIRRKSEKKVENGTETINEMLRNINAVSEARLQKALHEILLTEQIYKLKNINNN